jgi:hypothetical protein
MNRTLPLLAIAIASATLAADATLPATAAQARKAYDQQLAWAEAQYKQAVVDAKKTQDGLIATARTDYERKLRVALDAALKSKNLEEANRINAEMKSLSQAEVATNPFDAFAGTWTVTYTNGAVRSYLFDAKGVGRFTRETHEGRTLDAVQNGRLQQRGKDIVIDWGDGKIERLTVVDGRMFVEHFNPASRYGRSPTETMGTGVRR